MTADSDDKAGADVTAAPVQSRERRNWAMAEAWVAWLIATIAPALTFDIDLILYSGLGIKFQAFFQILCTALFLIFWVRMKRFPLLLLGAFAVTALCLFVAYSLLREVWSCQYYDEARVAMGSPLLVEARNHLAGLELLGAPCLDQMSEFGGEGNRMWPFNSLVIRFLVMFGIYALAWMTLALLVVGASFERRVRKKEE